MKRCNRLTFAPAALQHAWPLQTYESLQSRRSCAKLPRGAKMLACAYPSFDRPMILFQNIVEILHRSVLAILLKGTFGFQVGLQANNLAIEAASTQLVNQFAEQLTTPGSDLRTLIQKNIVDHLTSLKGRNPPLPVARLSARNG
jgi:hypothetical protein